VKPHVINSGRQLTFLSKYPAELIASLESGLMVDIGAATGETTLTARKANPASRVAAYEPFPGNLPYLERAVKDDSMVIVRPVAVSDFQVLARSSCRRSSANGLALLVRHGLES
jgi:hypothetical protein